MLSWVFAYLRVIMERGWDRGECWVPILISRRIMETLGTLRGHWDGMLRKLRWKSLGQKFNTVLPTPGTSALMFGKQAFVVPIGFKNKD